MALTKHTARKTGKGFPRAVKKDVTPVQPVASMSKGRGGQPVALTSGGGGGGRGKPKPKVLCGRIDRQKQLIPVRRVTMEEQIRKAQRSVDLSFSKAHFARSVFISVYIGICYFCIFKVVGCFKFVC